MKILSRYEDCKFNLNIFCDKTEVQSKVEREKRVKVKDDRQLKQLSYRSDKDSTVMDNCHNTSDLSDNNPRTTIKPNVFDEFREKFPPWEKKKKEPVLMKFIRKNISNASNWKDTKERS